MTREEIYGDKIIFYVSKEIKEKLKEQAKKDGKSISEILRMLISDYLKKENIA